MDNIALWSKNSQIHEELSPESSLQLSNLKLNAVVHCTTLLFVFQFIADIAILLNWAYAGKGEQLIN